MQLPGRRFSLAERVLDHAGHFPEIFLELAVSGILHQNVFRSGDGFLELVLNLLAEQPLLAAADDQRPGGDVLFEAGKLAFLRNTM